MLIKSWDGLTKKECQLMTTVKGLMSKMEKDFRLRHNHALAKSFIAEQSMEQA